MAYEKGENLSNKVHDLHENTGQCNQLSHIHKPNSHEHTEVPHQNISTCTWTSPDGENAVRLIMY